MSTENYLIDHEPPKRNCKAGINQFTMTLYCSLTACFEPQKLEQSLTTRRGEEVRQGSIKNTENPWYD